VRAIGWPAWLRISEIGPCAILLTMPCVSASMACSCSGVKGPYLRRAFSIRPRDLLELLLQTDDGGRDFGYLLPRHGPLHLFATSSSARSAAFRRSRRLAFTTSCKSSISYRKTLSIR